MVSAKKKRRIKIQSNDEYEEDLVLNVDSLYKTIEERVATVMKPIIKPIVDDVKYIRSLVNPRIIRLDEESKGHEKRLGNLENRPFKLAPILFYVGILSCNAIMVYVALRKTGP